MTTQTSPNPSGPLKKALSPLSLNDKQLQQLESLEVNHHLIPASLIHEHGKFTVHMVNGEYKQQGSYFTAWLHIHASGEIIAPQDNSIYDLTIMDGNNVIYHASDIHVGQAHTFDYNPGLTINYTVLLRCTSDPHKTADITVEGDLNIG